jgi:hypothetical protein
VFGSSTGGRNRSLEWKDTSGAHWQRSLPAVDSGVDADRTIGKFYSSSLNRGTSVPLKQQGDDESLVLRSTALVANGN